MDKMNRTRQLILDVSKNIFLENGYSATTFQMIADVANISKTSINYYYARKQDISNEILSNYISQCREFVVSYGSYNDLLSFSLMVIIFFKAILSTEQTKEFFGDLIKRNNVTSSPHEDFQRYYLSIIYQLNLNISPEELALKKISIFGAVNEFSVNYLTGKLNLDDDGYISAVLNDIFSILRISDEVINNYVSSSFELYNSIEKEKLPVF